MARILTNDQQTPVAAYVFALQTNFLDGCFDFHNEIQMRLEAPRDPRAAAVRIKLDGHFVADKNADLVKPHLAREIRDRRIPVRQGYAEERVGERLFDDPFNDFRFSHNLRFAMYQKALGKSNP